MLNIIYFIQFNSCFKTYKYLHYFHSNLSLWTIFKKFNLIKEPNFFLVIIICFSSFEAFQKYDKFKSFDYKL